MKSKLIEGKQDMGKALGGKVPALKTFYNRWDGHTYFMHDGLLACCPRNKDGSHDVQSQIYVTDFDVPLSESALKQIMDKLK